MYPPSQQEKPVHTGLTSLFSLSGVIIAALQVAKELVISAQALSIPPDLVQDRTVPMSFSCTMAQLSLNMLTKVQNKHRVIDGII